MTFICTIWHWERVEGGGGRVCDLLQQYINFVCINVLPGDDEEIKTVSFFEFVTNPDSFGQTVENIFHMSFLINVSYFISECYN